MTATPLRPPLGYFGSKTRIAPRIVDLLPAHRGYVEPYCGSLAVFLAKPPSPFEVINDLDRDLMHFWRILRERGDDLERVCALTPHSRAEYEAAWPIPDGIDDLERARLVWVKLTQGRSGSLRVTGWRYHETSGGRSSSMPRTLRGYVERFGPVIDRLAAATLECRPALEVIAAYGRDPQSLIYVDPPYPFGVRGRRARNHGSDATYRHEMGEDDDHRAMAQLLRKAAATVVVSSYPSPLYEDLFAGWDRVEIRAGTGQNARVGWQERTEVLWCSREFRRQGALWDDHTGIVEDLDDDLGDEPGDDW